MKLYQVPGLGEHITVAKAIWEGGKIAKKAIDSLKPAEDDVAEAFESLGWEDLAVFAF